MVRAVLAANPQFEDLLVVDEVPTCSVWIGLDSCVFRHVVERLIRCRFKNTTLRELTKRLCFGPRDLEAYHVINAGLFPDFPAEVIRGVALGVDSHAVVLQVIASEDHESWWLRRLGESIVHDDEMMARLVTL